MSDAAVIEHQETTVVTTTTNMSNSPDKGGPNISPVGTGVAADADTTNGQGGGRRHITKIKVPAVLTKNVQRVMPQAQRQQMDFSYAKSLPGLLKVVTSIVAFVTFMCAISSKYGLAAILWVSFLSWSVMCCIGALMSFYVIFPHLLADERTRNGMALVELLFYLKGTIAYFIALWFMVGAAAGWATGGNVLAVIFCVIMTVIFGVETFLKFMNWRNATGTPQGTTQQMP